MAFIILICVWGRHVHYVTLFEQLLDVWISVLCIRVLQHALINLFRFMTYCELFCNIWCHWIIRRKKKLLHFGFEIGLICSVGCTQSDTNYLEYKEFNLFFPVKYYLKCMNIRICYNFLRSPIPNFTLYKCFWYSENLLARCSPSPLTNITNTSLSLTTLRLISWPQCIHFSICV